MSSLLSRAKEFLQHNPSMGTVLEYDFDAWTPRGHEAAEAICEFARILNAEWRERVKQATDLVHHLIAVVHYNDTAKYRRDLEIVAETLRQLTAQDSDAPAS